MYMCTMRTNKIIRIAHKRSKCGHEMRFERPRCRGSVLATVLTENARDLREMCETCHVCVAHRVTAEVHSSARTTTTNGHRSVPLVLATNTAHRGSSHASRPTSTGFTRSSPASDPQTWASWQGGEQWGAIAPPPN